jgi:hypothetical protein
MLLLSRKSSSEGGFRYKARWVARGDLQKRGEDFTDTFALAGDYNIYKLVASYAAAENASIHALDITTAFLNAEIDLPDVVTALPPFFFPTGFTNPVGVLKKGLYGLRQSPKLFVDHLTRVMKDLGYVQLVSAPMLFKKSIVVGGEQRLILVTFYVDDGLGVEAGGVRVRVEEPKETFVEDIQAKFACKVKDLTRGAVVLGMEMQWNRSEGQMKVAVGQKVDEPV